VIKEQKKLKGLQATLKKVRFFYKTIAKFLPISYLP